MAALAMLVSGCPGTTGDDGGVVPPPESSGVVVKEGEALSYTFDAEQSDFVITVKTVNGLVCSSFHDHAVEATSLGLVFNLDATDPAGSTMDATVAAAGLLPDSPELRDTYLDGEGPLAPGDINSIKGSVLANVNAENFPTLKFSATNFSDLSAGATGTVDVTVDINGGTQTISMAYTLTEDGDNLLFDGTGTLPGAPHGIPSGFASECVDPDMGLFLKLLLVPGENNGEIDAGVVVYTPEIFPYEGDCTDKISFNAARDVVVAKCAGCHSNPPVNGATIPLVTYDDFRTDSFRHQGEPVFQTAGHFIERPLDGTEGLPMPPPAGSLLTETQKNLALDWIAQGAPDCPEIAEPVVFTPRTEAACGDVSYDDEIKPLVDSYCVACHFSGQTEIPVLESFDDGLVLGIHAYYSPLVLWESSLYRILDHSMPTYSSPEFPVLSEDETVMFQTWVEDGYPKVHCN